MSSNSYDKEGIISAANLMLRLIYEDRKKAIEIAEGMSRFELFKKLTTRKEEIKYAKRISGHTERLCLQVIRKAKFCVESNVYLDTDELEAITGFFNV